MSEKDSALKAIEDLLEGAERGYITAAEGLKSAYEQFWAYPPRPKSHGNFITRFLDMTPHDREHKRLLMVVEFSYDLLSCRRDRVHKLKKERDFLLTM